MYLLLDSGDSLIERVDNYYYYTTGELKYYITESLGNAMVDYYEEAIIN